MYYRPHILIFVLSVLFVCPLNSTAQIDKGAKGGISETVLAQMRLLRLEKQSRTPAQRKIGSRILHEMKYRQGDIQLRKIPKMKSGVEVDANNSILVDIKGIVTPGLLNKIQQLGGMVVNSFDEYGAIRARLPVDNIESLAVRGDIKSIRHASRAFLRKATTSEGDIAHSAATTRTKYSLTGRNKRNGEPIKVGVLSDSVDWLSYVQSLGDLPGVQVLDNAAGTTGEGTAMLEIIHDLAPDAQLYFASGWKGKASFASNIKALASAGCQVIVDDLGYLDESPFQDDIISQAVNSVTSQGVLYFSAAGNSGSLNKGTSGVWEGNYNGQPAIIDGNVLEVHNFGQGDITNRITADRGCYTLFWSDPLGGSGNDYDLYLIDPFLNTIVGESSDFQDGNDDPVEGFCVADGVNLSGYSLIISKYSGQNRYLHLSANGGRFERGTKGQITGHPAAKDAFAVSAVNADGRTSPFVGTEQVASYTSDGPRQVFYYPNGTAITPGNVLSTGGTVRAKPDISAADCVETSTPGFSTFCGSSAAAPHVAGIAALMLSAHPEMTVEDARLILSASVFDIEAPGWDRDSGVGLVMADKAVERALAESGGWGVNPGIRLLLRKRR